MPRSQARRARRTRTQVGGRRSCRGRASLLAIGLASAIGWGALVQTGPAAAQTTAPPRVRIDLMVSRLSNEPGRIDPRAAKLHEQLAKEFRYESLEVVKSVSLDLAVDEVGGMDLPTGKRVQVRPLLVDERGVLLAVEVEGSVQTDLRVRSDQLVIIGTERSKGGKLVISLEPHL